MMYMIQLEGECYVISYRKEDFYIKSNHIIIKEDNMVSNHLI